ncbi:MAG: hypothetical protein V1846_05275 [Candidatus Komeilibacteria bacterium]
MFDDVKKDDRQVVSGPVPSGPGPTEDMFSEVDPTKDVQTPPRPSAVAQGVMKPAGASPVVPVEVGPTQPLRNLNDVMLEDSSMVKPPIVKRILIWLLSVAVIVVVGWGGFYVYANFIAPAMNRPATTNTDTTNTNTINQPVDNTNQPDTNTNTNTDVATTTAVPNQAAIDTDGDSLTDVEEQLLGTDLNSQDSDKDGLTDYEEVKIYGTDPLNPDTDNDGLTDREEVITWKTNPKNPDTDGDGFQDGTEVKSGYNPAGPGKLTPDQLPSNQPQ